MFLQIENGERLFMSYCMCNRAYSAWNTLHRDFIPKYHYIGKPFMKTRWKSQYLKGRKYQCLNLMMTQFQLSATGFGGKKKKGKSGN